MGGFGLKSRNKQSAPIPLDQKKRKLREEICNEEQLNQKSKRKKVPRSGGKSVASKKRAREKLIEQQKLDELEEEQKEKNKNKKQKQKQKKGEDEDEESEINSNESGDDDEDGSIKDEGLEAARE
ncbi:hypothetical protein CROQUDRAFT_219441 [Cronartium quercuum f. sp. fusiforme G11]|uniref:Uncharacterized protein n=1 Tax=Cronartium quercuum f. sp. fusiforme G11 TaxID=708437 RepID=A0A9P6NES9_9BASI|nr:hypothetical protein CROQUDRAFT_219441 [Cronartium quercuum f. sp. fusiforme G11]